MAFGVKYFETITGSIINWFSGNNREVTDFNVGSRIRTMFESVAIELEQIYYQLFIGVNDGISTAVYDSFNFPLLQPAAASGNVRFSRTLPAPAGGITIPAGTQVGTPGTDASPAVLYQTTDTVLMLENTNHIDAFVVATSSGIVGNAPANTITVMFGAPSGVEAVTNLNSFFSGRDIETSDQRQVRFAKFISNLSRSTLGAIENAALQVANVVDAVALESPRLSCFVFASPLATYSDISFEVNLPSGNPQPSFPKSVSTGDALYIGGDSRFNVLKIDVDAVRLGGAFSWEYWNGSAWILLPYTGDSSLALSRSGFLTFNKPANWRDMDVNGVRKFWIRLRATNPSVSQVATIFQIKASPLPGIVNLVAMDSAATLPDSLRQSVDTAVEQYRAAGIGVLVVPPMVTTVAVTVNVLASPLTDAATLKALIAQKISDFISTFTLNRELILSELVQFVRNQSTDIIDVVIVAPTDNLNSSYDEVLRPGTVTVTVQQ